MPLPVFVDFSAPLAVLDAASTGEVWDGFIGEPSAAAPPLLIDAVSGPGPGSAVNLGAAAIICGARGPSALADGGNRAFFTELDA